MADHAFESQLQRLFAEQPAFADSAAFAARIQGRLDRGWAMRRLMIGGAGAVGGGIAVVRLVGSNVLQRLAAASDTSAAQIHSALDRVSAPLRAHGVSLGGLQLGGSEVVWLVAGLAALAVALFATRALEEI